MATYVGKKFIYNPIGYDMVDPKVIIGQPIPSGSEVVVVKEVDDPRHAFVYIMDKDANEMSVYKKSLDKLKEQEKG